MRSSSSIVTPQIAHEIDNAVRVGRKLRHASRAAKDHQREVDALKHVVGGLFEYADVQRMQVSFKKCTPTCDDDENDTGNEQKQYYEITVEMKRIDDQSHGGRLLSGSGLASACEQEVKAKLESYQARLAKPVLEYARGAGEYQAARQSYTLHFELCALKHEQEVLPAKTTSNKRRKTAHNNNTRAASVPDANECIQFYTKQASTWSLFGYDVSSWFRPTSSSSSRFRKSVYNKNNGVY